MADDPVEGVARAAAQRLAADFGPRLEFEVEAALAERDGPVGAGQYDPVTLGVLVVAIVQLAWSVYDTFRKEHPEPARRWPSE